MIAMSGGVDSSVAAALMSEQGYECMGVTMRLHEEMANADVQNGKTCCSLDDVEDARSVAFQLGMPFQVFNFKEDFEEKVIRRFVCAYENGTTPNPCIDCNRFLKFERLYERAKVLGYDTIVTGHYARVEQDPETGRWLLKKGVDEKKDQSYVLYSLTQDQLAHTVLPLGGFTKPEIREKAEALGFVNAEKAESQDICFVPDGDYTAFIEKYTGKTYPEGEFVDKNGKVLGTHKGIIHYTVGQRRGLGIASTEPYYVCEKDIATNRVVLGYQNELMTQDFEAREMNWIAVEEPVAGTVLRAMVRSRYHQKETEADVTVLPDGSIHIHTLTPVRLPAKGQAAVLYDGDVVIAGGEIF